MLKVSIITPVKNGARYIRETIESVLSQDYPNVELVLSDGGSTDCTLEIIKEYASLYPDKISFISEPNKGTGDAWNKGVLMSKGEILGWLGSDDLLYPDAISRAVKYFDDPATMFIYGEGDVTDEKLNVINKYITEPFNYKRLLNDRIFVLLPACFYRREVFQLCGMNDDYGSDYYFYLRVGQRFPFIYAKDQIFCKFRLHGDNDSYTTASQALECFYRYSMEYGGNKFNIWAKLYYATKIKRFSQPLRPYLGFLYPLGRAVLHKVLFYENFKNDAGINSEISGKGSL